MSLCEFGAALRDKRNTSVSIMESLSEDELNEFREIFNLVDKDGGGSISKEELSELLDTLGIDATPEEVEQMIGEIDSDGTGDISFEEFVQVMSRKVNANYTSEQVRQSFRVFEKDCPTGYVKAEALMKALCTYGSEHLTEDQARDLVGQLEIDNQGLIHYSEYIQMMMQQSSGGGK